MKNFNMLKKALSIAILAVGDFVAFSICFALAFLTRKYIAYVFFLPEFIVSGYLAKLFWLPLVYLFFFFIEGLYTKRLHFWYELRILIKAIFIAFVVCLSIVSIGKLTDFISRLFLFFLLIYSLIIFPLVRIAVKTILFHLGIWKEKALVVGTSKTSIKFAQNFNNNKYLGFEIIGLVSDKKENIEGFKVLSPIKKIQKIVQLLKIKTVVLDENSLGQESAASLFKELQSYVGHVIIIPKIHFVQLLNSEINYLFVEKLFILSVKNNLKSITNKTLKRIFDLSLSFFLLILLAPLMFLISIAIKIDSKGSVFYISQRIGQAGKLFNFLKFRTMYENNNEILQKYLSSNHQAKEEWEQYKKLKGFDPRVTRVGRFLRKTSLDELPQIINVILGQMSLVGPRPYLESELKNIGKSIETIVLTKPGITGLWQVSGRNELDFQTRVELDCFYVTNWSLWFDIIILLKTIQAVLKQKGAY